MVAGGESRPFITRVVHISFELLGGGDVVGEI